MTREEAIKSWSDEELVESFKVHEELFDLAEALGNKEDATKSYKILLENSLELIKRGKEHLIQ